jgi:hypothetical protein
VTYAPTYNRLYNFSNFQAVNPTTPLPASQVDAELSQIKITLDAILQNLALIQKSDGTLQNGIVGNAQLTSDFWTNSGIGTIAPATLAQFVAYLNSLPTYTGSGPAPVPTGQLFWNNGILEKAL